MYVQNVTNANGFDIDRNNFCLTLVVRTYMKIVFKVFHFHKYAFSNLLHETMDFDCTFLSLYQSNIK